MTTVSPPPDRTRAEPEATEDEPVDIIEPEPSGRRRPQIPEFVRRATWRFWVFTPVMAVLVLAVPVLTWKGFQILRNEDTGTVVGGETDPTAEGYEALVTPTPTAMIVDLDANGGLTGATLVTRPSQSGGGNVVFMPQGTVLDVPLPGGDALHQTMAEIEAGGGTPALEQRVETMIGAGIMDVIEVPAGGWEPLVAPVAPLTVDNPSSVTYTDPAGVEHSFAAGEIQLAAADVDAYLEALGPEETDLVRVTRHEAFWKAWLRALDDAGEDAVPGEGNSGIGATVRGLIGGPRAFSVLPIDPVPIPGSSILDSNLFRPRTLEIVVRAPQLIPFPVGVLRLRTRLVDGVGGDPTLLPEAARLMVQAGAEISVIANADQFGVEDTSVVYFDPLDRERAQRMLDALGTGTLVHDTGISDTVDVVVILGQDYVDLQGGGGNGNPSATTAPGVSVPASVPIGGADTGDGIPAGITPGAPGGDPTG